MVFAVVCAFILLDFVTGTVAAVVCKEWSSSVMREGLWHKTGSLLCLALAALAQYATGFVDLDIEVPILPAVCSYICLMEIGSTIENLGKINPQIVPATLRKFFAKLGE